MLIELKVLGDENQRPSQFRPVIMATVLEVSALSQSELMTAVAEFAHQLLCHEARVACAKAPAVGVGASAATPAGPAAMSRDRDWPRHADKTTTTSPAWMG